MDISGDGVGVCVGGNLCQSTFNISGDGVGDLCQSTFNISGDGVGGGDLCQSTFNISGDGVGGSMPEHI